jgi:HAD superfamily hydrolase (TIGR01509 family)
LPLGLCAHRILTFHVKELFMAELKAVIFGAIGVIAETSDLQRQAFNAAFKQAGLDWKWSAIAYQDLLKTNGGEARIRAFRDADPSRASVDDKMVKKLHAAKEAAYVELLGKAKLTPRAGVKELMEACIAGDVRMAWCTSTSEKNVKAIKQALGKQLPLKELASVVTIERIAAGAVKPAPDAYLQCLEDLALTADDVVAVEDTPVSIAAAKAAGIVTVATPGELTANQDFAAADLVVTSLSSVTLESLRETCVSAREPAFENPTPS